MIDIERLARWCAARRGGREAVEIADLVVPKAGFSNETVVFTARWSDGGEERLVLRMQPDHNQLFFEHDVFHQARMMEAVAATSSVPVPRVVWQEPSAAVLGAPFFVMDHVAGQVANGYHAELFAELSPQLCRRLYDNGLQALATIHRLDWIEGFGFLARGAPSGLAAYLGWVDDWYRWARSGARYEAIETGLGYLRDHLPSEAPTSVIWGDSRPGNLLVDPRDATVNAVLDWELAALATPEVDIAWWLMFERRFSEGADEPTPAGAPTRDETLTAYERHLGRPLGDVAYFDVLAWTRIAITFVRHVEIERGRPTEDRFRDRLAFIERCLDEHTRRRRVATPR